jgi:hypothetical protein
MEELLRGDAGLEMQEFGKEFCKYRGTTNKAEERELRNLLQREKLAKSVPAEDPEKERRRLRMEVLSRLH